MKKLLTRDKKHTSSDSSLASKAQVLCRIENDQIIFSDEFKNFLKSRPSAEMKVTTVCGIIRGGKSTFLNHYISLEKKELKSVFKMQNGVDSCTRGAYFIQTDDNEILIDVEGDGEPRKDSTLPLGLRRLFMAIFIMSTSFIWWSKNFDQMETEALRRTVLDIVNIFPNKGLKPKIYFAMKNADQYTTLPNSIEEVWRKLINEQHEGFESSQWELLKLPYPMKTIKLEISFDELMSKSHLTPHYLEALRSIKQKIRESPNVKSCSDLLELCSELPEVLSDKGFEFDRMYNHKFFKLYTQYEQDLSNKLTPLSSVMPCPTEQFQALVDKNTKELTSIYEKKLRLTFPDNIVKEYMEELNLKCEEKTSTAKWQNNLLLMEKEGKLKASEVKEANKKKLDEESTQANSLRIIDALWFCHGWWSTTVDETTKRDVTQILKSRADGKMHFEMAPGEYNTAFGNIAVGFKKFLRVDYAFGQFTSTVTIDSDLPLVLSAPSN